MEKSLMKGQLSGLPMEMVKLEISFNAAQSALLNLNKSDINFMNMRGFLCIWLQQSGAPSLQGVL
jgi:hypothetical protein